MVLNIFIAIYCLILIGFYYSIVSIANDDSEIQTFLDDIFSSKLEKFIFWILFLFSPFIFIFVVIRNYFLKSK